MLTPPHFRGKEKDGAKVQNKKKISERQDIKKEQRHEGAAPLLFL